MKSILIITTICIFAVAIFTLLPVYTHHQQDYSFEVNAEFFRGWGYVIVSAVLIILFYKMYMSWGYWKGETGTVTSKASSELSNDDELMDFYITDEVSLGDIIEYRTPMAVTGVEATSSLTDGLTPERLVDGNIATSWQEGVDGDGVGESVTFSTEECPMAYMVIYNGNQRDADSYRSNYRPSWVQVIIRGEGGVEKQLQLPDTTDPIIIKVDNSYDITEVILTIDGVYTDGAAYEDTCISEVEFYK